MVRGKERREEDELNMSDNDNDNDNDNIIETEDEETTKQLLQLYKPYHIEYKYQIGLGKIYDPILIETEKNKDYFAKEYQLFFTGIGNRVFNKDVLQHCQVLGHSSYDPSKIDYWSEKILGIDPAFYGSSFGIVINEIVNGDIRVLYAEDFHRKDTQYMIDKILDLRVIYRNIKCILIDASASEFIMDLKMYFDNQGYEYPDSYNEKIREWDRVMNKEPWEMGMYVIPVPFNKRIEYTQRLKRAMENGNYHIHPTFEKLLLSYDTAVSTEKDVNDIDKSHTENNDVLDAQLCIMRKLKPI